MRLEEAVETTETTEYKRLFTTEVLTHWVRGIFVQVIPFPCIPCIPWFGSPFL
jgi:hypothetical protein